MEISKLERLLHDRWYRWEAMLLGLQRQRYTLPESEVNRLLHRAQVAKEDYKKVAQER